MDLIKALRGELNNCECHAYSRSECGCDAVWPEEVVNQAADEIEQLRKERDYWEKNANEMNAEWKKKITRYHSVMEKAVEALERIAQNKYSGLSTASLPPIDQRALWAEQALTALREALK